MLPRVCFDTNGWISAYPSDRQHFAASHPAIKFAVSPAVSLETSDETEAELIQLLEWL